MTLDEKPLPESPSQTAGPYVHIGCMPNFAGIDGVYTEDPGSRMISDDTLGERITLRGSVYDGEDNPLRDAVLEIWQADATGLYPSPRETRGTADPNFGGWGRCAVDLDSGEYAFATIRPGSVPYPDGRMQAPHVTVWIVARGINVGLHTRIYFADADDANAQDPVLAQIEPRSRVATLMARAEGGGVYRFDIRLQGERETVFLDM